MKFYVDSVSGKYPKQVQTFSTLKDIINFHKEHGEIIITDNFWYHESTGTLTDFYGVTQEEANEIVKCEYSIEIYDDYRE